jgi:MerR family transcriptional regulator, light-induced transcriptional regulator
MAAVANEGGAVLAAPGRLEVLERTCLVDSAAEEEFDRLTRLAAASTGAPTALVSLVLPGRVFFKSAVGLPEPWASRREAPLSHSYCLRAVVSRKPVAVGDARADAAAGEDGIAQLGAAAYAGIPLVVGGEALGTLCALDAEPRSWTDAELGLLEDLAAVATEAIVRRARGAEGHGDRRRRHGGLRGRAAAERGLNIAAVAQRTGVAADTLRKWERRYGVLRPMRTGGGQRRYDESDLAVVRWLKARLTEGYRIGEAAALLGVPGDPAASAAELGELILEAVRAGDAERLARLLDQAFALPQVEAALLRVVAPALDRIGAEWEEGTIDVAREHLVITAVRARLDRLLAEARGGVRGPVLLACAPGERHELGLLMLAVLLHADGWRVAFLGADAPLEETFAFASRIDAGLLCLSVALSDRFGELAGGLGGRPRNGLEIVLGGRAVTRERAEAVGARFVGNDPLHAIGGLRRLAE